MSTYCGLLLPIKYMTIFNLNIEMTLIKINWETVCSVSVG